MNRHNAACLMLERKRLPDDDRLFCCAGLIVQAGLGVCIT